jgi:hypothetical protein
VRNKPRLAANSLHPVFADATAAGSIALTDDWLRDWMPYCFHRLPGIGRHEHVYLPLNRHYKPLGQVGRKRVRYEDYASQAVIFYRDPMTFEGVWTATKDDKLWLYDDAAASRVDYFKRLGRLMSQKVRAVGKASFTGLARMNRLWR